MTAELKAVLPEEHRPLIRLEFAGNMVNKMDKNIIKSSLYLAAAALVLIAAVFASYELFRRGGEEPYPENGRPEEPVICDYGDPQKIYLKKEKGCVVDFGCALGKENFVDECGCGCKAIIGRNIVVDEPEENEAIGLPLTVKGQARVFENTFAYRIKDADGSLLLERSAMADSPDTGFFGPFEVIVNYPKPKGATGLVEVFEYSAKDGSEINKVVIPVVFKIVESMEVKVFFPNSKKDPEMLDCSHVYSINRRVPKTQAVARAALDELLIGPDRIEAEGGYFTSINSGVKIQKLTIENGIAKADFNDLLEAGVAGSCRVISIASQIRETLKQFSTVKTVVISINGRTEDILQP